MRYRKMEASELNVTQKLSSDKLTSSTEAIRTTSRELKANANKTAIYKEDSQLIDTTNEGECLIVKEVKRHNKQKKTPIRLSNPTLSKRMNSYSAEISIEEPVSQTLPEIVAKNVLRSSKSLLQQKLRARIVKKQVILPANSSNTSVNLKIN